VSSIGVTLKQLPVVIGGKLLHQSFAPAPSHLVIVLFDRVPQTGNWKPIGVLVMQQSPKICFPVLNVSQTITSLEEIHFSFLFFSPFER
jgi:hypothetical protein